MVIYCFALACCLLLFQKGYVCDLLIQVSLWLLMSGCFRFACGVFAVMCVASLFSSVVCLLLLFVACCL